MKDLLTRSMFIILIAALLSCCSEGHLEDDSSVRVQRLLEFQGELEDDIESLEKLILCHLTNETVQSHDDLIQNRRLSINNEFYDVVISKSSVGDAYYFEIVKYDAGVKHTVHRDEYLDLIYYDRNQGAWLRTEIIVKGSHLEVYQLGYSFGQCAGIIFRRKYELHPDTFNHLSPFEVISDTCEFHSDLYNDSYVSCIGLSKGDYPFLRRIQQNLSSGSRTTNWDGENILSAFVTGRYCSI